MKKEYIITGLAVVGAVALFTYLRPKGAKRNSEGFFNIQGLCVRTNSDGSTTQYTAHNGKIPCPSGGRVR
jgi:hypothetical protein